MSVASMIAKAGHVVDIEERTTTQSDTGGRVPSYSLHSAEVPCWVQPAGSDLVELYAQRKIVATNVVYFATNPGIQEGWRLNWNGTYLIAWSAAEDQAGMGKCWRVVVGAGR